MLTINPRDTPIATLHAVLLSAVAPRPIALASTVDAEGRPNLSPFSFFNVFSANPPVLIFSPARRVRDNTTKHTLENVIRTREVVVNVVSYDIVQQTSLSSTEYEKGVNEFDKSGLTMLASEKVKPFRVRESPIQFECRVNEVKPLGDQGGAGNLVICEVLLVHIAEEVLNAQGGIDQNKLDLVARAGGNRYSRLLDSVFEIEKPLAAKGIGVDKLPEAIKNSEILTGNDLGQLANVTNLPEKEVVDKFIAENPEFVTMELNEKHKFAHRFLKDHQLEKAWKVLLS